MRTSSFSLWGLLSFFQENVKAQGDFAENPKKSLEIMKYKSAHASLEEFDEETQNRVNEKYINGKLFSLLLTFWKLIMFYMIAIDFTSAYQRQVFFIILMSRFLYKHKLLRVFTSWYSILL